jgi:hypothetical protein
MIDFSTIDVFSDQPTTCYKCGARTEIVFEESYTKEKTQIHRCANPLCKFEFVTQYDSDFDDGSLL